jgi:hypothetical protein
MTSLVEANARIDFMLHIAGAVTDPEALPPQFTDFLEDAWLAGDHTGELARLIWPWFGDVIAESDDRDEAETNAEIAARLFGFPGYLVYASTPVMQKGKRGLSYFSWGYTNNAYLYAETSDDIERVVCEWALVRQNEDAEPTP